MPNLVHQGEFHRFERVGKKRAQLAAGPACGWDMCTPMKRPEGASIPTIFRLTHYPQAGDHIIFRKRIPCLPCYAKTKPDPLV